MPVFAEVGWPMHSDSRRRRSSGIRARPLATLLINPLLADRIVGDHEISAARPAV
jgi:hypothetical protein